MYGIVCDKDVTTLATPLTVIMEDEESVYVQSGTTIQCSETGRYLTVMMHQLIEVNVPSTA